MQRALYDYDRWLSKIYVREEDLASEENLRALYDRWQEVYRFGAKAIRFEHFKQKARTLHDMNKAGAPVEYHLNAFSDMSQEEYAVTYASCGDPRRPVPAPHRGQKRHVATQNYDSLPPSVDWRGVAGRVTDQGQCGSCYAFAATAALEAAYYIEHNITTTLSVQQLVDCSKGYGNSGCNGGSAWKSFQYVIDNKGIDSWARYPYVEQTRSCGTDRSPMGPPTMRAEGYYFVEPRDEKMLMDAVARQPVVVSLVGANATEFQQYAGGIFKGPCGTAGVLEALLVGYGSTPANDTKFPGVSYWLVKNSWGDWWGEDGYMRIQRGDEAVGGVCGIMLAPVYPANTHKIS
jgi:KDEL-tailed cysteine endopeptidase